MIVRHFEINQTFYAFIVRLHLLLPFMSNAKTVKIQLRFSFIRFSFNKKYMKPKELIIYMKFDTVETSTQCRNAYCHINVAL